MRLLLPILIAIALLFGPSPSNATEPRTILLVVSGYGLEGGRARPGYEFDELSQAYLVFRDNGFDVQIASPLGGAVEADEHDVDKPYNALFLADGVATARLAATRPLHGLNASDYAAIFVIGGKGVMFDMPYDPVLKALLVAHYQGGGVLAAVCHGPAAFVGLKDESGAFLIAGQAMAGFTNEEEFLFETKWAAHFPFLLEDALIASGARFSEAEPMLPFVQTGDRIVTGQNPSSTAMAAEATVSMLGMTPVAREPWSDERTLALVARFLDGETTWAKDRLATEPALYEMPLIGLYGYYRTQDATADATELAEGLALMELAAPYFDHPRIREAMAAVRARLGRSS
jgi:putative intracellular protease/amidase